MAKERVTCWTGEMWFWALDIEATILPFGLMTKVVRAKNPWLMAWPLMVVAPWIGG